MKKQNAIKHSLKAGALAAAGLVSSLGPTNARAGTIAITNNSFELSNTPAAYFNYSGANGVGIGQEAPMSSRGANYDITTNSGTNYLLLNNNYGVQPSASQTTSPTASTGDTYILSAEIGEQAGQRQSADDFTGSLALLIDGTIVAENPLAPGIDPLTGLYNGGSTETPVPGTFDAIESLTYTALSGDEGGTIGVELLFPGMGKGTRFFDDLQLYDVPAVQDVPEPSQWGLLVSGLVSLLTLRRWRPKQGL